MTGQEFKRRAWAVLFPERCAYCGKVVPPCRPACDECDSLLPRIMPPICPLCGREKSDCTCGKHRRHFERVIAPFYYEGKAAEGVARLKNGNRDTALPLAEEMARVIKREYSLLHFDMIVPVPMTLSDMRSRGYNQSELLAKELSILLGIPAVSALRKIAETAPQKSLTALERTGNLLGVFDRNKDTDVEEKTVLLVDDINTTGSTMDECAKMLKIFGAKDVFAVTVTASSLSKKTK